MSRGLGVIEKRILKCLEKSKTSLKGQAIAAKVYRTSKPTWSQCSCVYRSAHGLWKKGHLTLDYDKGSSWHGRHWYVLKGDDDVQHLKKVQKEGD
jgi:hypothetical protein